MISGVYAIVCQDYVKIGQSDDVVARLGTLQVGCPYPMYIWGIAKYGNESFHHKILKQHWERGEWFKFNLDVSDYLIANFMYYDKGILIDLDKDGRRKWQVNGH